MNLKLVFAVGLGCVSLAASAVDANAGSSGYGRASDLAISTIEDVTHGDLRKLVELSTWLEDWDGAFKYSHSWGCGACTPTPTPLPPALPLYGLGLGTIGLLSWYRKRKSRANPD